jgi:hypothetical protein
LTIGGEGEGKQEGSVQSHQRQKKHRCDVLFCDGISWPGAGASRDNGLCRPNLFFTTLFKPLLRKIRIVQPTDRPPLSALRSASLFVILSNKLEANEGSKPTTSLLVRQQTLRENTE